MARHDFKSSNDQHAYHHKRALGRLARSDAPPSSMPTVAGSILRSGNILSWRSVMK